MKRAVNVCCSHATCQRLIQEAIDQAVKEALDKVEERIRNQASVAQVGSMEWRAAMADVAHVSAVREEEAVTHEEIVAALHTAHLDFLAFPEDKRYLLKVQDCEQCTLYAEWVAPLLKAPDTSAVRGLTSVGAATLTLNGVAYVRQDALIAAIEQMDCS